MIAKTTAAAEYVIHHLNRAVRKFHLNVSEEFDLMTLLGAEIDGRFTISVANTADPVVRDPGVTTYEYPSDDELKPHLLDRHRKTTRFDLNLQKPEAPPERAS